MEAVHVQLPYEGRDVGVFEVLAGHARYWLATELQQPKVTAERGSRPAEGKGGTYASTFENSCEGCMTKLSAEGVHEIRCCIDLSSSMLSLC